MESLISNISAESLLSLMGPDLQGELTHVFAPKIKRNFDDVVARIACNASNVVSEYSLCYTPLNNIQLFCTVDDRDASEDSNRVPLADFRTYFFQLST